MNIFKKRWTMVSVFFGISLTIASSNHTASLPLPDSGIKGERDSTQAMKVRLQESYGNLPYYFIQNDGQVDKQVKFYEKGPGHTAYFTNGGLYLSLLKSKKSEVDSLHDPVNEVKHYHSELIRLIPLGANKDPNIIAEELQDGKANYFIGNDPKKWRTNISTYRHVVYKEVYPGIDMKFYGNNRQLEYDIVVKPGADPSAVRLAYEGIESLNLTGEGNLEIILKEGKLIQRKPVVYQEINGKRMELAGKFKIDDTGFKAQNSKRLAYSFDIASYNKNYPLIIDPTLVYSTYLGGSSLDAGYGIAVDASGNAYITGFTDSFDFPTANSLQGTLNGFSDVFVTKLNAAGSALVYSTFLGGSSNELAFGIAVDISGNAYVTGSTHSPDFPMASPLQSTFSNGACYLGQSCYHAFVAKLNAAGSALVYSTFLGGSDDDQGNSIAVDASGNSYVTGFTHSLDFPTASPFQGTFGGSSDAFVSKLNAAGSALVYSTFLGGSTDDQGNSIAVDASGNAFVTGATGSTNFPLASPLQNTNNGGGAFITKLNAAGSALVYSTYLGGSLYEQGNGIAVDTSGNAYVAGFTFSSDFPTASPLQSTYSGNHDAFVTKLNAAGSALVYSTYLGGSGYDHGNSIAVDASGNAYVTGETYSSDFPTASPLQSKLGGYQDAFVTKLNAAGSALVYSTYLGGSSYDQSNGITVDTSGNAYVTGDTGSLNFPTASLLQGTFSGTGDAFVVKIADVTPTELINLSTRAFVQTGSNVEIGGFYIGGSVPKTVLIRARGPSMSGAPFNVAGTLSNPTIQLYSGSTVIAQNDNWQTTDPLCGSPAVSCGDASQIMATGLDPCQPNPGQTTMPPGCAQESAILVTLPPGGYTAIESGAGGTTGIGLVEVFEVISSTSKLINISTRSNVQTGNNVMIGGFYIGGTDPKTVLIRARGPSMSGAPFNVPGTLSNPTLQLYSGSTVIAQNDDWQTTDPLCGSPAVSCGNTSQIMATGLDPCQPNPGQSVAPPGCLQESAILVKLPPGGYTAIVSGIGGETGVGLVEVFEAN